MNYFSYLLDASNWDGDGGIGQLLLQHLAYTVVAVVVGAVIAIPLGVLIGHTGRGGFLVIGGSNAARAIPSLGLLVLVVLLTGTGFAPTVLVLAVLALPAILTATAVGIAGAEPDAVYAARALGMTGGQVVRKVEWPLAVPLVISGPAQRDAPGGRHRDGRRLRRRRRAGAAARSTARRAATTPRCSPERCSSPRWRSRWTCSSAASVCWQPGVYEAGAGRTAVAAPPPLSAHTPNLN